MRKKLSLAVIVLLLISLYTGCTPDQSIEEENNNPVISDEEIGGTIKDDEEEADTIEDEEADHTFEFKEDTLYLSVDMNYSDIVQTISREHNQFTEEEFGGLSFYTLLEYEGITFYFSHTEDTVSQNAKPDLIEISSNDFSYRFNIDIGGNAKEAIAYLSSNFRNTYDMHSESENFDMFDYTEVDQMGNEVETGFVIKLEYDQPDYFESLEDMPDDTKVVAVSLFLPLY
jgi:hypothetical protein